ncbi:MAG: ATP-binding protein [Bacillota bacterium]
MVNNFQHKSFTCPSCQNRGFIIKNGLAYPCNCVEERSRINRLVKANLGRLQHQSRFENFSLKYYPKSPEKGFGAQTFYHNAKIALEVAKSFAKEFAKGNYHGQGLLLTGNVGSGKTFLASAIANYVLENGKQVLFTVVPDLLDEIKATYDRSGFTETDEMEILGQARTAELLILDDLGVHNYTEWTVNKIYSILNYRANHQLPLVITTNLSLADLDTFLGERTTSRILQLCKICRLSNKEDIRYLKSKEPI